MEKTAIIGIRTVNKEADYEALFKYVERLRIVMIVAGGRAGTDFFQSLLDGHSQVLQIPGLWFLHLWWKNAKCKEKISDLINEFIWYSDPVSNHIAKFKSYCNKLERWDKLGKNRDESFEVDIDNFRRQMLNILSGRELNSRNFFLAVNIAYALAAGVDIKKTKIIFYHIHHIDKIEDFKKDFPDFDIIFTIREPRNMLVSGIEHWKRYSIDTYNPKRFYELLKRIFDESEPILQHTRNFKTLRLEDTHLHTKEVMDEFCRAYDMQPQECMFEASYHGRRWWGDALSGRYLDTFNKNIEEKKWKDKLFWYDNFLMEFILEDRLRHYGYSCGMKMHKVYWVLAPFFVFLPMRYELRIAIHNIKIPNSCGGIILALGKTLIFYILRVFLYFKFIWKKSNGKIFLADFFNQGMRHSGN